MLMIHSIEFKNNFFGVILCAKNFLIITIFYFIFISLYAFIGINLLDSVSQSVAYDVDIFDYSAY